MPRVLLAAVAALVVLSAQGAHGGPLAVPCETLTRLDYCAECAKPAGAAAQLCYLCHPTRASVWKTDGTGTVSQVSWVSRRRQLPAQPPHVIQLLGQPEQTPSLSPLLTWGSAGWARPLSAPAVQRACGAAPPALYPPLPQCARYSSPPAPAVQGAHQQRRNLRFCKCRHKLRSLRWGKACCCCVASLGLGVWGHSAWPALCPRLWLLWRCRTHNTLPPCLPSPRPRFTASRASPASPSAPMQRWAGTCRAAMPSCAAGVRRSMAAALPHSRCHPLSQALRAACHAFNHSIPCPPSLCAVPGIRVEQPDRLSRPEQERGLRELHRRWAAHGLPAPAVWGGSGRQPCMPLSRHALPATKRRPTMSEPHARLQPPPGPAPPADGACTLCTTTTSIVVPLNAIYINAAGQGSTVRA